MKVIIQTLVIGLGSWIWAWTTTSRSTSYPIAKAQEKDIGKRYKDSQTLGTTSKLVDLMIDMTKNT